MKKDYKKIMQQTFMWLGISILILATFCWVQSLTSPVIEIIPGATPDDPATYVNYGNLAQITAANKHSMFWIYGILKDSKVAGSITETFNAGNGAVIQVGAQWNDFHQLIINYINEVIAAIITTILGAGFAFASLGIWISRKKAN